MKTTLSPCPFKRVKEATAARLAAARKALDDLAQAHPEPRVQLVALLEERLEAVQEAWSDIFRGTAILDT